MNINPSFVKDLHKTDLRYISDESLGIKRKKAGGIFKYFDTDGKVITSEIILKRIEDLSIPPAWTDTWICPSPSGYLQAIGYDDRKRKQYIYHPKWTELSQENKFHKVVFFGELLPQIRKQIAKDMALQELEYNRIVASVIWLLEHTFIRIGNDTYATDNQSFGLTTLRNRHVKVRGKNVKFEFRGKSGIDHSISISNPRIAKIIKECIELPGYEIFKYLDESGDKHIIDSSDVNNYLKTLTGEDISAKDFRTWGGTILCASILRSIGSGAENDKKKNISHAVKRVSQHLHNTATVCRNYYIHPVILETYQKDLLIPHFEDMYKNYNRDKTEITRDEYATLSLLRKYS